MYFKDSHEKDIPANLCLYIHILSLKGNVSLAVCPIFSGSKDSRQNEGRGHAIINPVPFHSRLSYLVISLTYEPFPPPPLLLHIFQSGPAGITF
jgi:hypothetical protein